MDTQKVLNLRVLVCGSTTYDDYDTILGVLTRIRDKCGISVVINGAAKGADSLSTEAGRELGIQVDEYPADWHKHGRRAGMLRNQAMLRDSEPDIVLAFFDGRRTPGTSNMVRISRRAGVEVREYGLGEVR